MSSYQLIVKVICIILCIAVPMKFNNCSKEWVIVGNSSYCFHDVERKSWHDSRLICQQYGGDLIKIDNDDDSNFISDSVTSLKRNYYWTGLNDIRQQYKWEWTDQTPLDPQTMNWRVGEPNNFLNSNERCVEVAAKLDGKWSDNPCDAKHGFICERLAVQCRNITFGDKNYLGEYYSGAASVETVMVQICKYGGGVVYGHCMMGPNGRGGWLPFNLTECNAKNSTYISSKLRDLMKVTITNESIEIISMELRNILKENATTIQQIQDVDNVIKIIENILKTNNENTKVNQNILESLDLLGDLNKEISKKSTLRTKVLFMLDEIASASFRTNKTVSFSGKNFALATTIIEDKGADIYISSFERKNLLNVNISKQVNRDNNAMIKIPKETIQNNARSDNKYFSFVFKEDLFFVQRKDIDSQSQDIDSYILSATIYNTTMQNLTYPIQLSFEVLSTDNGNRQCSFWKENEYKQFGKWSTDGCRRTDILYKSNKKFIQCECNHLTNFAVMFTPGKIIEPTSKALDIISYIGCGISMISLLITLITYISFKKLHQKVSHRILINFCLSLLLLLMAFVYGARMIQDENTCKIAASLIQLFLLSTFFWMGIEGIGLYKKVVRATKNMGENNTLFWICFVMGWGIPTIITICTAVIYKERQHLTMCVIIGDAFIYTTLTPISIVMALNYALFLPIIKKIQDHIKTKGRYQYSSEAAKRVTITFSCTLLLGLTWVFGFLCMVEDLRIAFQWLFCIFNTLQGFFIFVFHVIRNNDAMRQWNGVYIAVKQNLLKKRVDDKSTNNGAKSSTVLNAFTPAETLTTEL